MAETASEASSSSARAEAGTVLLAAVGASVRLMGGKVGDRARVGAFFAVALEEEA